MKSADCTYVPPSEESEDRFRCVLGCRVAAQIGRTQAFFERAIDVGLYLHGVLLPVKAVAEHHRYRPAHREWILTASARDVGRRTVHRLAQSRAVRAGAGAR